MQSKNTHNLPVFPVSKDSTKKRHSINFGGLLSLLIVIYLIYYMLLQDDLLPFSIHSVLSHMNHWTHNHNWHVLAVGLMPIYLSIMIFGTALFGMYLGSALYRWVQYCLTLR